MKTKKETSLERTLIIAGIIFILGAIWISFMMRLEKKLEASDAKIKRAEWLIAQIEEADRKIKSLTNQIDEARKEFSRDILAEGEIPPERWDRFATQKAEFAKTFTNYSTSALYFIPFYGNSSLVFKEGTNLTEVIIDKSMILFGGDSNIVRQAADAYTNIFAEPFELRRIGENPSIILVIRGEPKLDTNGLITLK